jgi:serine/threonine-protein kinase
MGEVYRALDTRLDRIVAIKQLESAHSARFEQEARAIAALNHPYICTLYDIGTAPSGFGYLVMEFVEGVPLVSSEASAPMDVDAALKLAKQLAAAISEAHSKGILHRDLKPANILKTRSGIKVLDFGLAKFTADTGPADATQTREGTILGTAAYMSPEQVQGKSVDVRSDIFSFGAVLYELFSGQQAFRGGSAMEVFSSVLRDEPPALQAPDAVARLVRRCLAKKPADRFASMAEIVAALDQIVLKPAAEPRQSIAVLPFANLSADKENEYFSDGLAEEILNLLARVSGLKVTARTSSFAFRGMEQDVRKIAQTLNVRAILEGSVRRAGNRIRVTAQLIDAAGGHHIWSERYDRELTDVFAVQDEIASAIAGALRLTLAGKPASLPQHKPNVAAYEALLKGRYYDRKITPEGLAKSKDYFEQAIELDPDFAEAHAYLGGYYLSLWTTGLRSIREVAPWVRAQARKAADLSFMGAHALLGVLAAADEYDWNESELHFRLVLTAAQAPEEARSTCTSFYLSPTGRIGEAVEILEKMVESDPLNVRLRSMLGNHLTTAERYDESIEELRKVLEIDENAWFAHAGLVRSYVLKGVMADALLCAETAYRLAPWNAIVIGQLAAVLVVIGDRDRAEGLIRELIDGPKPHTVSMGMVFYHVICEESDAAAGWFEKAIEQRDPAVIPSLRHPLMKPLQASSRWPALGKMMNLRILHGAQD